MDRVRTERSATRRVLGRALLVLGGAAAAWALGSATAAADTGVDLAEQFGAAVESAPLPDTPIVTGGKAAVVDLVDRTLTVLHVEDGAKAVDEFGKTVTRRFADAATPGQHVSNLLPDLPDLSPRPGSAAADGPLAVAPEAGRPVAVPAAAAQRHGEPAPSAATPAGADPTTRRGPPATSPEVPGLPSGPTPLTLPAPAHSGHTGAGSGDTPQFGLLSTASSATEPVPALIPRAARVDVPAAVDAQPGVTPD